MDENENRTENETGHLPEEPRRSVNPLLIAAVVVLCIAAVAVGFIVEQQKTAGKLSSRNHELTASLTQTRGEVQTLSAKLNNLEAQQAKEQAAQAERARVEKEARREAVIRRERVARIERIRRREAAQKALHKDDPRWKQVESELAQHQKAIDATQQDLANAQTTLQNNLDSARDQLSGTIAKNHSELVALERLGARKYYEFDMFKNKRFHRVGPIEVSLRRTNNKHQFCNLKLIVNDRTLTKKHIDLYEPVLFYTQENGQPMQLVINEINRHHMHGYLSVPKYQNNPLASGNTSAGTSKSATASTGAGANAVTVDSSSTASAQPSVVDLRHQPAGNMN